MKLFNPQVDLKQMTSTSPIYAPIKRVSIPAVATSMKLQEKRITAKLALANLTMNTNSGQVISLDKPYIQVKKFISNDWTTLESVDVEMERIYLDTKMFEHMETLQKMFVSPTLTAGGGKKMTIKELKTSSVNLSIHYSQISAAGEFFRGFTKQYEKLR